ncbi:MAG: glutathione ABC transporter ATP-binding protein [Chloroflexi bacterium]|nr:MAG: glutathione ABC transporter ATP-binding protein [Chloroflexota bacterium]
MQSEDTPLLRVENLQTHFFGEGGVVRAVDDVTFDLRAGEVLGVVGESGSGKSVTALSVMRLIDSPPGRIIGGSITFDGDDVLSMTSNELRNLRGNQIAMIFQEPLTSLNPVFSIGDQIMEPLMLHQKLSSKEARDRATEMLARVGVPSPAERLKAYPHQLSGGMRQRAMIAMALSCNPKLLIADEPTTALDVSIQAQILELMKELQESYGSAMMFITHDLGVVNQMCDRVNVMYAGRIVEQGTTAQIFSSPKNPYTWGLFDCLPRIDEPQGIRLIPIAGQPPNLARPPSGCKFHPRCPYAFERCRVEEPPLFHISDGHTSRCWLYEGAADGARHRIEARRVGEIQTQPAPRTPILEVTDLRKHFPITRGVLQRTVGYVKAVDGISFTLHKGETLGLVGESGCGKSTAGRVVLRLLDPTSGSVMFHGQDLAKLDAKQLQDMRKRMQIIFQDPFSSLNPRRTVGSIVGQPIQLHKLAEGKEVGERVADILERVGLNPSHAGRYPHEFSGGQRQRIGIARAIAANPEFIVADEPVSALDVSIQAQIVNLLQDLQRDLGLSYIFIAHDLSVVRSVSDRVAVMYLGKIVEIGDNRGVYEDPLHPYTRALLSAVPSVGVDERGIGRSSRIVLQGDVPSPINPPSGCRFHTRCPYVFDTCRSVEPLLTELVPGHAVACHLYDSRYAGGAPDSAEPLRRRPPTVEAPAG